MLPLIVACASDGAGTAPAANSAAPRLASLSTPVQEPAEFVRQSRPTGTPDFIPVGVTPPARAEPKRDAAAVEKLEKELDAQRNRSRSYAARPRPASSYDGKILPRPKAAPVAE